MTQIDESFAGRKIELPPGETLELNLKENATAGFRWHLRGKLEPQLTLESEAFIAPDSSRPGQPGTRRWRFKAGDSGSVDLVFQYQRSPEEAPTKNLSYTVQVT